MEPTSPGPGHDPVPEARERRRDGRMAAASTTLVPLLRGQVSEAALAEPEPAAATPARRVQTRAGVKGCEACRTSTPLFPFTMAFQPIVDMQERRIDAYEALVRGPDGESAGRVLGQVTLENTYSFDQACRVKAIELAAKLGMDRQLSINFLPNAVYDPRACIQATLEAASRTGFRLDRLTFEILESETIADTGHLLNIITEYRKHGFKIALDDFATGYSGLSRLAELKPDIVKIDRALAQDCDQHRNRLAIVGGLIRIGQEIGVKMVVEGVEREGEVAALRSVGVRFIQGFYFAKPGFERLAVDADIAWG